MWRYHALSICHVDMLSCSCHSILALALAQHSQYLTQSTIQRWRTRTIQFYARFVSLQLRLLFLNGDERDRKSNATRQLCRIQWKCIIPTDLLLDETTEIKRWMQWTNKREKSDQIYSAKNWCENSFKSHGPTVVIWRWPFISIRTRNVLCITIERFYHFITRLAFTIYYGFPRPQGKCCLRIWRQGMCPNRNQRNGSANIYLLIHHSYSFATSSAPTTTTMTNALLLH